jgi:hypothetical protein
MLAGKTVIVLGATPKVQLIMAPLVTRIAILSSKKRETFFNLRIIDPSSP